MTLALLATLLPALLLPHAPISPVQSSATRVVAIRACEAGPSSSAAADQPKHAQWRRKAKSAGKALVLAAALAVPRGPARAAQLPPSGGAPAPVSRAAAPRKRSTQRQEKEMAFLGLRKKKTLRAPLPAHKLRPNEIDMDALVSKKAARRFTERGFIFSDALVERTELELELAELDEVKTEREWERTASSIGTYGVVAGGVYATVKGLTAIERWMKQQELADIEEERELTGQYISVDAGDVETAIDPLTGKNLTIVQKGPKKDANATAATGGEAATAEDAPWILRVLGLAGAKGADDDDFWATPTAASSKPQDPDGGAPAAGGDGGGGDGSGGGGTDGGEDNGGGDGLDDDTSGLDQVDDLLG